MASMTRPSVTRWRHRLRAKLNMPLKYAAYRGAHASGPIFPDRIYIESTNHCNLKCIMCPTGLGVIARPKGYMEMGLYRQIVDEVGALVGSAVLHSWGEPLMHPELFEMIRYGKRAGMRMETSTNITLLNDERARQGCQWDGCAAHVAGVAADGAWRHLGRNASDSS